MKKASSKASSPKQIGIIVSGSYAGQSFPLISVEEGGLLLDTPAGYHDYPESRVALAPSSQTGETVEIPIAAVLTTPEPSQPLMYPVIGRVRKGHPDVVLQHQRALRSLTVALGGKRGVTRRANK